MNDPFLEDQCEDVDASVFSGAFMSDVDDRRKFEEYVNRWKREITRYDEQEQFESWQAGVK